MKIFKIRRIVTAADFPKQNLTICVWCRDRRTVGDATEAAATESNLRPEVLYLQQAYRVVQKSKPLLSVTHVRSHESQIIFFVKVKSQTSTAV